MSLDSAEGMGELASNDELTVYTDEGEEERRSSEHLSADKLGLVKETESIKYFEILSKRVHANISNEFITDGLFKRSNQLRSLATHERDFLSAKRNIQNFRYESCRPFDLSNPAGEHEWPSFGNRTGVHSAFTPRITSSGSQLVALPSVKCELETQRSVLDPIWTHFTNWHHQLDCTFVPLNRLRNRLQRFGFDGPIFDETVGHCEFFSINRNFRIHMRGGGGGGEGGGAIRRAHIKKPLNAFMLFMKETRQSVIDECTLKESAAINQILGRRWHSLDRSEQARYYELAKKEKELHRKLYPDWSARDNYATHTKRRKSKRVPSSEYHAIQPDSTGD